MDPNNKRYYAYKDCLFRVTEFLGILRNCFFKQLKWRIKWDTPKWPSIASPLMQIESREDGKWIPSHHPSYSIPRKPRSIYISTSFPLPLTSFKIHRWSLLTMIPMYSMQIKQVLMWWNSDYPSKYRIAYTSFIEEIFKSQKELTHQTSTTTFFFFLGSGKKVKHPHNTQVLNQQRYNSREGCLRPSPTELSVDSPSQLEIYFIMCYSS